MVLNEGQQNLATVWGNLQAAMRDPALRVGRGSLVQYAWNVYQQSYLAQGQTPPRATLRDMNSLLSLAGSQYRAELALQQSLQTFQSTGIDQALTAAHVAPDIDARPLDQQPLGPEYRVRFQAVLQVEGETMTPWLTWSAGLNPPATVSALLDQLDAAAQAAIEDNSPINVQGADYLGLGDYLSMTTV